MDLPPSARELTEDDWKLVELARVTIDANTDAPPDEDGVHTMGAAVRAADGRMFAGVNLYHFTEGPCAELGTGGRPGSGGGVGRCDRLQHSRTHLLTGLVCCHDGGPGSRSRWREPATSPFGGGRRGLGFGVRAAHSLDRRRADVRADDRRGPGAPSEITDSAGVCAWAIVGVSVGINLLMLARPHQPVDAGAPAPDRALGQTARVGRNRCGLPSVGCVLIASSTRT